uniref:Uncharacterized protein n=1 Tax=Ciona savignyi TaxID=51511 RepID=H2YA39_CIOSA
TVHHNQAFKVEEEYEKYEVAYEEIGDDYSLEKNKILDFYVDLTANYNAKIIKQFGDMARKIDFNAKPTFKKMVKLSCSVGSDKGYQLLISPSPRVDNLPTFW